MTVTVKHPRLPGVARVVLERDLDRWVAQGWLPPETPARPARARRSTTRPRRRRSTSTEGSES